MKIIFTLFVLAIAGWMGRDHLRYVSATERVKIVPMREEGRAEQSGVGSVRGKVMLSQSTTKTAKSTRGLYGKSISRLASGASIQRQAIVFVERVSGSFAIPQVRPAMRQKNITIIPRALPVLQGTSVEFPNDDNLFHNIFSLSSTRSFDLGRYARGQSRSVVFDRTGEVKVFCDIHSTMSGFVLVMQNPYFATTGADGSYQIANVPSGTYRLGAWSESGTQYQNIVVTAGSITPADFSF